jgi:hypothetical protein
VKHSAEVHDQVVVLFPGGTRTDSCESELLFRIVDPDSVLGLVTLSQGQISAVSSKRVPLVRVHGVLDIGGSAGD